MRWPWRTPKAAPMPALLVLSLAGEIPADERIFIFSEPAGNSYTRLQVEDAFGSDWTLPYDRRSDG